MQLQIDVLGKDGWAQIADLSEVEVPGSYVRPSGNSRVRLNETIRGESYSGQRYELSIYPQRSGEQTLPPIDLNVRIQTWGAQNATQEVNAQTETIVFTTQLPEGSRKDLPLIVSPKFSATQTWEPDQNQFTVGDALKRTITLQATELPAMVLPPLPKQAIEGLSSYAESPQLTEEQSTATRTESATYVFEQNATPSLPSHEFQWWNPETKQLKVITLVGRELSVTGGISAPVAQTENKQRHLKITLTVLTVIAIALIWLILNRRKQPSTKAPSESTMFKQLTLALRNEPQAYALNRLLKWLDCVGQSPSQFFESYADTETQATAAQLLADPNTVSDLNPFTSGLTHARKRYLQTKPRKQAQADAILPPLNL